MQEQPCPPQHTLRVLRNPATRRKSVLMGNMAELRPGIIDCGTEITLRSSPSPTSVGFKCLQGDIKITVFEVI